MNPASWKTKNQGNLSYPAKNQVENLQSQDFLKKPVGIIFIDLRFR